MVWSTHTRLNLLLISIWCKLLWYLCTHCQTGLNPIHSCYCSSQWLANWHVQLSLGIPQWLTWCRWRYLHGTTTRPCNWWFKKIRCKTPQIHLQTQTGKKEVVWLSSLILVSRNWRQTQPFSLHMPVTTFWYLQSTFVGNSRFGLSDLIRPYKVIVNLLACKLFYWKKLIW